MPLLHRGIVLPETLFFYRRRFSSLSNGRSAKVADFLVYQKLYADREKYSPAIRRGLELEFLNHMIQELYAVLGSSVSGVEKRRFFRYCQQACTSSMSSLSFLTFRRKSAESVAGIGPILFGPEVEML